VNDSTISCNYSIRANAPSAQGWLELSDGLPGYIGSHRYPTLKTSGSYLYFSANGSYSSDISGAGTYTVRSDRSMKENISTIDNCLSLVERLRGVQFTWKNSNMGDGLNYGFIAQEVQEVIPEIVSDNANVGLLGIAESKIIPFLVEAVKELKQIIDAKNNIITQLQSKIESLESKVTALEQSSQQ
jgi:hypothetical protein